MLKRILSVLGANVFGQVCTVLIQLLGAPLFLYFWGTERYGEWLVISALPTYFAISGTGISLVSGNKMQMLITNGDEKQANTVFQSNWLMVILLSLFILLLAVPFILFAPIQQWLQIDSFDKTGVHWLLILLCVHVLLSLQTDLFTGVYRAQGKFARGITVQNLLRILEFGGIILLLVLKVAPPFVASAYVVVRLAGILWMLRDINKFNWITFGFSQARWAEIKADIFPILSYLGIPLSQAFLVQGMTTVIGMQLGSAAVVVFSVSRTLVNFIKQFASVLHYAVLPEFSKHIVSGELETARRLHRFSFQLTFWFVTLASVGLYIFHDFIFRLWMQGQVHIDEQFFMSMLVVVIIASLTGISYFVPASINQFSTISLITLIVAAACTVLAYFLVPYLALLAVPAALLINELIMFGVVVTRSLQLLQDSYSGFIKFMLTTLPVKSIHNIKIGILSTGSFRQ